MSKKELDLSKKIMSSIKKGQIKMKPRWYFWVGSITMIIGFIAIFITSAYLISLLMFSLRTHGPMGQIRFDQLVSEFPLWAPILAIIGIVLGLLMLREYDFSYKKNFSLVILGIFMAVILAGYLMDYLKVDNLLFNKGVGQKMYQKYQGGYGQGYHGGRLGR